MMKMHSLVKKHKNEKLNLNTVSEVMNHGKIQKGLKVELHLSVEPDRIYESEIKPLGNGARANALKRHIGKKCFIIITDDE